MQTHNDFAGSIIKINLRNVTLSHINDEMKKYHLSVCCLTGESGDDGNVPQNDLHHPKVFLRDSSTDLELIKQP